jgi:hypothetical protein
MNAIPIRPAYLVFALIALPVLVMATSVACAVACTVVSEVVTTVVRTVAGA